MKLNQKSAFGASAFGALTRRSFLAVGATAAIPAGSIAIAADKTDSPPTSLENQLDECVAQLRDILQQMHPEVTSVADHLRRGEDGTFHLSIKGHRLFSEYDGPGVYLVSAFDQLVEYYLERYEHRNVDTGEPLKGCFYFEAVLCLNCMPVEEVRPLHSPQIVRKLADRMNCADILSEGGA